VVGGFDVGGLEVVGGADVGGRLVVGGAEVVGVVPPAQLLPLTTQVVGARKAPDAS